jgi:hypothetical protein
MAQGYVPCLNDILGHYTASSVDGLGSSLIERWQLSTYVVVHFNVVVKMKEEFGHVVAPDGREQQHSGHGGELHPHLPRIVSPVKATCS